MIVATLYPQGMQSWRWRKLGNYGPGVEGVETLLRLEEIDHRHNHGWKNYDTLQVSKDSPGDYPMFNDVRYSLPCVTVGAWESKKDPRILVHQSPEVLGGYRKRGRAGSRALTPIEPVVPISRVRRLHFTARARRSNVFSVGGNDLNFEIWIWIYGYMDHLATLDRSSVGDS